MLAVPGRIEYLDGHVLHSLPQAHSVGSRRSLEALDSLGRLQLRLRAQKDSFPFVKIISLSVPPASIIDSLVAALRFQANIILGIPRLQTMD